MRRLILGLTLTVAGLISTSAMGETATFDFEDIDLTSDGDGNDNIRLFPTIELTQGGVTMTITHQTPIPIAVNRRTGVNFVAAFGFQALSAWNGQQGAADPGAFILDFNFPLNSIVVEMGDIGGDADTLSLESYSGPGRTGSLLDSDQGSLPAGGNTFGFQTLSVQGPLINSVVMIGGSITWPNSVFYDNITVDAVPEPSTLSLLFAGAFSLLAYASCRRRKNR